jgi:AI-2 transport protein TqsA
MAEVRSVPLWQARLELDETTHVDTLTPAAKKPSAVAPPPRPSIPPRHADHDRDDRDRGDERVWTACLLILTFVAVGIALALLRPVLVPFVLALLFTYCLSPIVEGLRQRLRFPRWLAIAGGATVGLLALAGVALIIAASAGTMSRNFGLYQQRFNQLSARVAADIPWTRLGVQPDPETGAIAAVPAESVTGFVATLVGEVTAMLSQGTLVAVFVLFLLIARHAAPRAGAPPPHPLMIEIEIRVQRFVRLMVLFSFVTGALVWMILGAFNVPFAGFFGLLAFLLNFIPTLGSIIATLLPVPLILLSPTLGVTEKVLAIALPATVQILIGLLQPRVQGQSLDLHPITVLLSLIFFGMIWGFVGAFLAAPITAVIKIILERIPATRPTAALLAGDVSALLEDDDPPDEPAANPL